MAKEAWRGIFEQVRRVQTPLGRAQTGMYSIEGIRLHERALRAGVSLAHVIVAQQVASDASERMHALLGELQARAVPVTTVPDTAVATITAGRDLGGMLGLVRLPVLPALADMVTAGPQPPLLLVAVNVADPGNVGALARTAHAAGASGLVAVGVSDPFHPKAQRTSMGSLFKLPFTVMPAVDPLLAALRELGIVTAATAVAAGATGEVLLPRFKPPSGGTAVLMGSEAWGLPSEILAQLDVRLCIPMAAGIDSYSVNAAAAIVLYELQRHRFVD